MKKLFGWIAGLSVILLLCVVQATEDNLWSLGQGACLCALTLGAIIGSVWLAGGFEEVE